MPCRVRLKRFSSLAADDAKKVFKGSHTLRIARPCVSRRFPLLATRVRFRNPVGTTVTRTRILVPPAPTFVPFVFVFFPLSSRSFWIPALLPLSSRSYADAPVRRPARITPTAVPVRVGVRTNPFLTRRIHSTFVKHHHTLPITTVRLHAPTRLTRSTWIDTEHVSGALPLFDAQSRLSVLRASALRTGD